MTYFRIGRTEIRLVLIVANAIVWLIGNPVIASPFGDMVLYDIIGVVLSVLFLLAFIVVMISFSRTLARQERTTEP